MMVPEQQTAAGRRLPMPWERRGRPALTGAWWARALCLDERCAAGVPDADPPEGADATAVADIRMERWRTAFSHVSPDTVELQTAAYGITPRGLRRLLAEAPEDLARRVAKPAWADDVERVIAAAAEPECAAEEDPAAGPGWQRGFTVLLEPFVHEALRLFDEQTAARDWLDIVDLASFRESVRTYTAQRLLRLAARVFVLELNVLRVTKKLDGDSPEERFGSFVRHYRSADHLAALLDEYAVLARQLVLAAGQAAEAHAEFLRRLADDRDLLVRDLFDGADPGTLTAVRLGVGDAHGGGRSVGIAQFASGRRAVYKPRPAGLHRHFNTVLDWFNPRLPASARLRALRLLDRGSHGWVEFIEPANCADAAAASRYFVRQGVLLALLHCLAGVDFHFENLIAAGEQPVPIDLETICYAELPRSFGSDFLDGDPALAAHRDSVGRVGLLPSLMFSRDGKSFDAGGMGGDADAVLPFPVVDWDSAGTDEMRVTRILPTLGGGHHRPRLDDADLDVLDYADRLLDGFRTGYRLLTEGRGELTAPDGPLAAFTADQVRIIARSTHDYAVLLAETTHPDALRDALDRDQVFGVLWARASADPTLSRLVRQEVRDLWSGDVPLFTATAGAHYVRTAAGALVAELLPETGLARVERTLAALGDRDLEQQLWIVSAHLAARAPGTEPVAAGTAHRAETGDDALHERALAAARGIMDRLEGSAYRNEQQIGWLGLDFTEGGRWSVRPLGADLYNGYAGIALFAAQLAHVTGEDRYAALAHSVLGPLAGYVEEQLGPGHLGPGHSGPSGLPVQLGAFDGLTGVALALASSAVLLGDDAVAGQVEPILAFASERIGKDDGFDVISGAAGVLTVAESLGADYGSAAHRLADRCVETLLAGAITAGDGTAWPGPSPRPLLGFSHGAAGIAWALLAYARRTGDDEATAAARRALVFERGEYDERLGNWPDHRMEPPTYQHTWCHGAPGIGLARAATLAADPTAVHDAAHEAEDLRRALDATTCFGRYDNHSLCHGELGNLELFAVAGTLPGETGRGARAEWHRRAAAVVAAIEQEGPVCGTPGAIVTPGLMAGLAGIGHGLLRIAAADQTAPALLLAAQPRVHRARTELRRAPGNRKHKTVTRQ